MRYLPPGEIFRAVFSLRHFRRIYMHHNMFNFRKTLLDIIMHRLGNLVRFPERIGAVHKNFDIHIYFVAEYTRLELSLIHISEPTRRS